MRVSYSMLSAWERKDFDTAIAYFLRLPTPDFGNYDDGRKYHDKWEKETRRTGRLPKVFGGLELKNPEPELYIKKKLNDWLELAGKIDLRDGKIMYEYKTGGSPASAYARGKQHEVYQILDPRLEIADYFAYNQHEKKVTFERVHLGRESLYSGYNWVITLASEMKDTLERLGYDTEKRIKKE